MPYATCITVEQNKSGTAVVGSSHGTGTGTGVSFSHIVWYGTGTSTEVSFSHIVWYGTGTSTNPSYFPPVVADGRWRVIKSTENSVTIRIRVSQNQKWIIVASVATLDSRIYSCKIEVCRAIARRMSRERFRFKSELRL